MLYHNVTHKNCYRFKNSTRSTNSVTGLDYSNAVILNDDKYIGSAARINDIQPLNIFMMNSV